MLLLVLFFCSSFVICASKLCSFLCYFFCSSFVVCASKLCSCLCCFFCSSFVVCASKLCSVVYSTRGPDEQKLAYECFCSRNSGVQVRPGRLQYCLSRRRWRCWWCWRWWCWWRWCCCCPTGLCCAATPHPTTPLPHPSPETPLGTCTVLPPPPETPSPRPSLTGDLCRHLCTAAQGCRCWCYCCLLAAVQREQESEVTGGRHSTGKVPQKVVTGWLMSV